MKLKLMILSLALMQSAIAAPKVILSPLDHLYVPKGFDSNDSVEVVLTGQFPNPCFSRNSVDVNIRGELIEITVTALEQETSMKSRACPDMVVPFKEVVSLGNLQGGDYKIIANRSDSASRLEETLFVDEAPSSAVDEHIYGAVDRVERRADGEYVLHATNYSPCFTLKEIQVISNERDTLSILPVLKQISDFCPMKGMPVIYPVKLDFSTLKVRNPLLHVRTMDGKSINTIVDLEGRR